MTEKEIQDILDELNNVRPEVLNDKAKRLFEAIMKIANERDELKRKNKELEADNYEANNIIKDLLDNIPVQKVKDLIKEIKERKMDIVTSPIHNYDEKIEMLKKDKTRIQILQELLEGSNQ